MKSESLVRAKNSVQIETEEILKLGEYLDYDALGKAVDVLSKADRIMTCANGTSGIACKKFAHSLCCVERSAMFMSPSEAVCGGMGFLKKGDAVVILSRGGKTTELFPIAEVCNKKGGTLIVITENTDSPLAHMADIIIPIKLGRESDKYNFMATSSFVVPMIIFDAIICAIMEENGYTEEMFGIIHPSGAVGERLNKK